MKKILAMVIATIVLLVSTNSVFALGLTAGTLRILVDVGSSNSSRFGLVNNGNETITVTIRAEGNAAQFLEFPTKIDLVSKKLTYVDVKATIPSTYDGSLGGNITGFIYAVQEGMSGQVQINVQAKKSVQILIPQYGGYLPEVTPQIQTEIEEENHLTGFTSLISMNLANPLLLVVISVAVLIFLVFVIFRRFEISIKPKKEVKD